MTKKDYILIAEVIKSSIYKMQNGEIGYYQKPSIIDNFVEILKVENPRFDENKFRNYIEK